MLCVCVCACVRQQQHKFPHNYGGVIFLDNVSKWGRTRGFAVSFFRVGHVAIITALYILADHCAKEERNSKLTCFALV